jgi:predicted aspartyl protease
MSILLPYFVAALLLFPVHEISGQQFVDAATVLPNDTLPFHLEKGFLICVEGRIGTLAPLKFILDTGTTHTVVNARIADRLSLQRDKGKILNFDKYVKADWVIIPDLQLGPIATHDVHVMVGDLKAFSEFAQDLDAIIGLDLLSTSQFLRIDYRDTVVTFKTRSEAQLAGTSIPKILTARVVIQGHTVLLIIDTGLQGLLLYTDRLRKRLPQIQLSDKPVRAHAGRIAGEQATLSDIRLGPSKLQSTVLLVRRAPDDLPVDIDGYLGVNVLHAQVIEIDFATDNLRWQ